MAYMKPPLLITNVTPVLIVGTVLVTLLANPGLGLRYRLIGCQLSLGRTVTGIVDLTLRDNVTPLHNNYVRAFGLSLAHTSGQTPPIAEPGIVWPENRSMILQADSTIAGGAAFAMVYYYIDPVT
jgi:hypothetical protein